MAEETPNPMGFNFVDLNATTKPKKKSQDAPLTLEQTAVNHPPADAIAENPTEEKLTNPKDQPVTPLPSEASSSADHDLTPPAIASEEQNLALSPTPSDTEDDASPPLIYAEDEEVTADPRLPSSDKEQSLMREVEPLSLGQVNLKPYQDKMLMIFPAISAVGDWTDLWEDIVHRFRGLDYRWPSGTPVHLHCREHLLGIRELQAISELLDEVELSLVKVFTTRRQTAVAAVTAGYSVEQEIPGTDPAVLLGGESSDKEATLVKEPLYYANTVRSGVDLNHPGSVIVVGDVNPGGSITAGGDILVWGMLRGIAHAGVDGDRSRKIMALQLKSPQVRIADAVALVPEQKLPTQDYPEIAYITPEGIRITQAGKFSKQFEFSDRANGWIDSSIDNFNEA